MSRAPLDTRFNRLVVRVPEHGETFLRKLPYMSGLRVSNRDIEYMFRRSARAVRRKNAVNAVTDGAVAKFVEAQKTLPPSMTSTRFGL